MNLNDLCCAISCSVATFDGAEWPAMSDILSINIYAWPARTKTSQWSDKLTMLYVSCLSLDHVQCLYVSCLIATVDGSQWPALCYILIITNICSLLGELYEVFNNSIVGYWTSKLLLVFDIALVSWCSRVD